MFAASQDRAPSFLLVGDSHAGAVAGGIFEGARRAGVSGIQLTESGYRPVPTLISLNEPEKYARMNVLLEEVLRNPAIRTVIVVAYWEQAVTEYRYATPDGKEVAKESGIQLGLSSLARTYSDRRFLLMTAPPAATIFGASPAARALLFGKAISTSIPRGTFDQTQARYDAVLRALDREPNVDVVDITDLLCDADALRRLSRRSAGLQRRQSPYPRRRTQAGASFRTRTLGRAINGQIGPIALPECIGQPGRFGAEITWFSSSELANDGESREASCRPIYSKSEMKRS